MTVVRKIYKKFANSHKNTQNNTQRFESKQLPSSGKTANPKIQLTQTVTHTSTQLTREKRKTNKSKNLNSKYANPKKVLNNNDNI